MIALTFALPDESRSFVASLTGRQSSTEGGRLPVITGEWQGRRVAVIHTGVGEISFYRRRLADFLATEKPRLLVSGGYAGGLQAGIAVGDLVLGENVSDPGVLRGARGLLEAAHVGALITRPAVAESVEEKAALGRETGALAIDMETAWIAAVCAVAGVPLLSLRAVSDAAGQAFPVPGRILFDADRQRPRYLALPAWLLCHPGRIGPFVRFVRGAGLARRGLAGALQTVVSDL